MISLGMGITNANNGGTAGPVGPQPFDPNNIPNFSSTLTSGVYPITVNWVAEGDSLTADGLASVAGPASWAPMVAQMLGSQVKLTMQAAGGRTLAQMVSRAAASVDTLLVRTPGVLNLVTYQGGINDIATNSGGGTVTETTLEGYYQTYAQARVAAGWGLVIPISVEASNYWNNPLYGSVDYTTVANWIRANILTWVKSFVDIPSDAILGPAASYSNISYYLDNTHKAVNGDARKARRIIYPVLQASLVPVDQASGNAIYGIYPPNGPIGVATPVGIRVTNLPVMSGHTVTATVGGQACTSITWDPTLNTVYCTVPAGSASGNVSVLVDGVAARGGTGLWSALAVVIIDSITPDVTLAAGAVPITIRADASGTPFSAGMIPTLTDPVLGVVSCTSVVIVSPFVMTCVLPALTPTVSGATPIDIGVGGSLATAITKLAVLPSPVVDGYLVTTDHWNATTGHLLSLSQTTTMLASGTKPTLVTSAFGGKAALQFVSGTTGAFAENTTAVVPIPWGHFCAAVIPSAVAHGGLIEANVGGGGGASGLVYAGSSARGVNISQAGGGSFISTGGAASYAGDFFIGQVTSTTASQVYVDGVAESGASAGAYVTTGTGLTIGNFGGFPLSCTVTLFGKLGATLSAQQIADFTWISEYKLGTP